MGVSLIDCVNQLGKELNSISRTMEVQMVENDP